MPILRPSSSSSSRPLLLLLALLVFGFALQGFWLEPRQLLLRDEVDLDLRPAADRHLSSQPLRVVHLSDLHIRGELPVLRRLLEAVHADEPDAIVISGDLVSNTPSARRMQERTTYAAEVIGELRRIAPVLAVQGHSEYQGEVVAALGRAGVRWLSNEGTWLVPQGPLLLGLNQQVGWDALPGADGRLHLERQRSFETVERDGSRALGVVREGLRDNLYLHWDPLFREEAGGDPARTDGPLSWSGYELRCELWLDDRHAGAGVAVHSRFVAGEDRMLRLRRVTAGRGETGTFQLVPHGTAFTAGEPDTGVRPEPHRWYQLRLQTELESGDGERGDGERGDGERGVVRVRAKVWPADAPEPAEWQAWAEDRSDTRVTAGTVGLWGWEEGGVAYRNLRVTGADGTVLLDQAFQTAAPGSRPPAGWREGARGSRLELALARSPEAPAGTPRIVLSHTPGVVLEAAYRELEAVLAGHTHGGQVRLPWVGPLTTRSQLGPHYDRGIFHFGSTSRRGWTTLHVSSGIGTSILPIRTFNPPRYALLHVHPGRVR